ncbi:MAG: Two-component transcriptional response regulator, LuxR family, partial [uncultured Blastococcus sp.]
VAADRRGREHRGHRHDAARVRPDDETPGRAPAAHAGGLDAGGGGRARRSGGPAQGGQRSGPERRWHGRL